MFAANNVTAVISMIAESGSAVHAQVERPSYAYEKRDSLSRGIA